MGKFNVNSIAGFEKLNDSNENQTGNTDRYKLGSELLDEQSKDIVKLRISNISRDRIKKNPENIYSIERIDELKESIKNYGLAEPINVKELEDGSFMLLGGERRLTAIDELIADETVPEWNEYTLIPCIVKDLNTIKLPLSDENKEKYAIITTNKEARKYTDSDKFKEIKAWKEIIKELRSNGVDVIKKGGNADEEEITIKGEKTRDIVAKATGIPRTQINRFEKVEKKAAPELLNAMLDNNISIVTAEKAVDSLNAYEQKKLVEASEEGKISPADINKFKTGSDMKAVTSSQFRKDTANISSAIKEGRAYMTEIEQKEYYKTIRKLENLIVKGV